MKSEVDNTSLDQENGKLLNNNNNNNNNNYNILYILFMDEPFIYYLYLLKYI